MENGEKKSKGPENTSAGRVEYPKSPESIDVYAGIAIIEKEGKFLVGKRPTDKVYPGKWEFVGGKIKVDDGETPEVCIVREVKEEIGASVEGAVPFLEWDYRMPDGKLHHLFAFRCNISGNCEKRFMMK